MSKERPILFSGEMVRAILDGRKTQTRRVMKPQPPNCKGRWAYIASSTERSEVGKFRYSWPDDDGNAFTSRGRESGVAFRCPFGAVGDRLWVREKWSTWNDEQNALMILYGADDEAKLVIDDGARQKWLSGDVEFNPLKHSSEEVKWKPSIHMPRWASRITLEICGVRVERLNDISEADAMAEGIATSSNGVYYMDYSRGIANACKPEFSFMTLWKSINGPNSWAANPWVWVMEFKKV